MRIHDLEAAEWREAAGGYHKKPIASDVALLDVGNAAELQMEGDGEHLIVVLNGSGKVAAGSRGAFLSGGICLGLAHGERVALRPDAQKGLLLLYVRLSEAASASLFAAIPERQDGWEIASPPAATVAEAAPAELEAARAKDRWEDGDDYDEGERDEADAEESEQAVTEEKASGRVVPAEEVAPPEAVWVAETERVGSVEEAHVGAEDDDDEVDDGGEASVAAFPAETEVEAEDEPTLAAASARPTEETPWYPSNRSNGAFAPLPRGQVHRTESGELVINGRAIHAGQGLSIYHRRRWVQTRARTENGHWYVVVESQHVPLVPGMRARLDF